MRKIDADNVKAEYRKRLEESMVTSSYKDPAILETIDTLCKKFNDFIDSIPTT